MAPFLFASILLLAQLMVLLASGRHGALPGLIGRTCSGAANLSWCTLYTPPAEQALLDLRDNLALLRKPAGRSSPEYFSIR